MLEKASIDARLNWFSCGYRQAGLMLTHQLLEIFGELALAADWNYSDPKHGKRGQIYFL
jgi:hypothetical protein